MKLDENVGDAADWYFLAEDGRLFSSALWSIISPSHASYIAWLASGNTPTAWPKDVAGNQTIAAMQVALCSVCDVGGSVGA